MVEPLTQSIQAKLPSVKELIDFQKTILERYGIQSRVFGLKTRPNLFTCHDTTDCISEILYIYLLLHSTL